LGAEAQQVGAEACVPGGDGAGEEEGERERDAQPDRTRQQHGLAERSGQGIQLGLREPIDEPRTRHGGDADVQHERRARRGGEEASDDLPAQARAPRAHPSASLPLKR